MTPKKANTFIPKVAEEMKLPEDVVEDIINFYWRDVRITLTGLKEKRIKLASFGTFEVRKKMLEALLRKGKSITDNTVITSYSKHVIVEGHIQKSQSIRKLLDSFKIEEERHKLVKEKRNGRII